MKTFLPKSQKMLLIDFLSVLVKVFIEKINATPKKVFVTLVLFLSSLIGFSQIAQRGTATTATSGGTSITITKPTGIVVGDLMIADIAQGSSNNITSSPALSGWTLIDGQTLGSSKRHGAVLYKVAVAADVSATNYTFTLDSQTDSATGAIIAFSGVNSASPFDVTPGTLTLGNTSAASAASITSVTPNAAIIMLGQSAGTNLTWSGWSATSPASLTELFDVAHNSGKKSTVGGAWATLATAGATGTGNVSMSASERSGAILLALRPITSPPTITSLGSTNGCPGTSITINGTNLAGATAVTIGGTPVASITSNTATSIVAVIGAGTTGTVSVTTGSGTATSAATFTVNAVPTITGTTPGSRIGTGTVVLGATASSGTISWFAASTGGVALGTGTSFTTPVISVTTTYYVEVSNGTCTSTPRVPVIATVNNPEIDIQGNAISIVDGDTTPTSADWTYFGTTDITTGTITRTFTIYNTGAVALSLGAITFSGVNAADFTVTTAPSATVAAGGSTTFVVTFNPSAAGTRNATISIANNDTDENPYDFALQGTGTEQEINVQGNLTSIADGDTTPTTTDFTDFGSTDVTTGTITRTFTIQNTGTSPLTIGAFSFTGANGGDFTLTTPPNPSIAAGGSSNFTVTFDPSGLGLRTATLSFVNNDSNENPYDFAIQGTGTEQEMDVQGNAISIVNNDATPSLTDWTDFGSTGVGIGITRTFTILNTGSSTLTIGAITFSGGAFALTTPPAASVAPGGSTTFVVTFTPTGLGAVTSNMRIVNNDSDENPYRFDIMGTGAVLPSEINIQGNTTTIVDGDITPSTLDWTDFAGSSTGVGITRVFTIQNLGTGVLTIGAITFSGTNAADFSIVSAPSATVAVGGSTTFTVQFTPGALGLRTAAISIVDNDSDENPYNFNLQGTGFAPLTNGPGGVTGNLQLWLRSDLLNGTTGVADGTAVNTWNTQGRGTDAIKPAAVGAPVYKNNPTANINFNSVVDFTNNYTTAPQVYTDADPTRQYLKGTTGFYSNDIYVVLIPDVTMAASVASNDIFCGDRNSSLLEPDATGLGYSAYTSRMSNEVLTYAVGTSAGLGLGYGVADVGSNTYSTAGIINARNNATITGTELTFNANNVINLTTDPGLFQNVANSQYWIGRSEGWDGSLDGRVAEIITLSSRATNIEKSNIQSYLAIKYGITLGINGTSMNYTNSNGATIWDATANSGYNYDIAGIGRDDISKLNQKQSKSINPTEVMTIGLTDIYATNTANTNTFATNKSYLTWGANGGTMVNSGVNLNIDLGPTTITTITEVVNRKWKVVETGGDVPTVRVNIPTAAFLSGLPALGPTDAYVMVVADNATFTSGLETVFMSTVGTNQTCQYDFDGTHFITFGVAHRATNPLHISLDGFDDFVRISDANELGSTFTVMTWVRPNGANTLGDERTIIAKKPNATSGYRLVLQNDNKIRMEWYGAFGILQSAVTNTAIPDQKWHNIAVTYGAATLKMYIDGVQDKSVVLILPPVATTSTFSIGSNYVNKLSILNLFKGDIDELRMWSRVLTPTEIRFLMNQEILQNGTATKGTIIPASVTKNDANGVLWSNLFAYYSMNSYIGTHLDDDSNNLHRGSLIIPNKISINLQTAPMPYVSAANGAWATIGTWANGTIQDLPYSLSIVDGVTPIDWNIVRTNHNVDSSGNKTLLGLIVNSNTLTASNDSKVEVSHYLKLNGKLDLAGKSQLIQTLNSDLDPTSAGSIERDQQGQKNIYNYNYWSSPVGAINATTNNNAYTVAGVMKDGTTTTPQNITWTTGLNGSPTAPITLSSYWIFKFQNLTNAYANWQSVGQNGSLNPGQGYTLKGSGAAGATQNFTFVGKPNNGSISSTVAANNLNLSGNPYASAIDADAFINDNTSSLTGTLYFWEHYSTNNTHALAAYQGGYATRTLVGGTPPVAPAGISGLGSSSKTPGRYIPVGQGFFVVGSTTGGSITFNNNQRAFIKEDHAASNTMFKNGNMLSTNHFMNNSEDATSGDTYKRVRLGLTSKDNYHRQILLGFMDANATSGIDVGYDAINIDTQLNDMYFMNNGTKLNIQGDGYFNINNVYPIGIKTNVTGEVKIMVDATENIDNSQKIYIHDNLTGIYNEITDGEFIVELPQGLTENRFQLTFKETDALSANSFDNEGGIKVVYTNANSILNIKNNVVDTTVESVSLFNMIGQSIKTWDVKNQNQQTIELPIEKLSSGTYIVKVKTDKGDTSRKIIIK